VNKAYNYFFFHYNQTPLLVIDTTSIDFVQKEEHLDELVQQIQKMERGFSTIAPWDRPHRVAGRSSGPSTHCRAGRLGGLVASEPVRSSRMTVPAFRARKRAGAPLVVLTAYDLATALAAEAGGVDCLLVGDSLGNVVLGYDTTLPVTLDEMLHHARAWAALESARCSWATCRGCRTTSAPTTRFATRRASCAKPAPTR